MFVIFSKQSLHFYHILNGQIKNNNVFSIYTYVTSLNNVDRQLALKTGAKIVY